MDLCKISGLQFSIPITLRFRDLYSGTSRDIGYYEKDIICMLTGEMTYSVLDLLYCPEKKKGGGGAVGIAHY